MQVALGLKAHSGWAALVVIGRRNDHIEVVDRQRIELVEEAWARQPYHAAETLKKRAASNLVKRGVEAAHRVGLRAMRVVLKQQRERENEVTACAVLAGNPMPDWTVEQILAVHLRMHQAEGVLFREALVGAAKACKLKLHLIPQKQLTNQAEHVLGTNISTLRKKIAALGKSAGPPWRSDQKDATLAALIALQLS